MAVPPPARLFHDPRRAPRVPLRVPVDVAQGGDVWPATTGDLGPGGCQLVLRRPLARLTPVRLVVRPGDVVDSLSVAGVVAWAGGARVGVRFTQDADLSPEAWFERLLRACPELAQDARRVPGQLAPALPLFFLPSDGEVDLTPDELQLLSRLRNGVAAGLLAVRAGLPDERFARALFALLERGVLTASKQEAVVAWLRVRPRAPAPRPTSAPSARPAPARSWRARPA